MLYSTYEQYQTVGGTLEETAFAPLCFRASRLIDRYTFGRAASHAAVCEDCRDALSMACLSIVKMLEQAETVKTASGYAPGLSSVSNDGFSVSFSDGALAGRTAAEAQSTLEACLGDDPHGLLYRGCF